MRFAITGTDARFPPLRKLLLADGHEITDPASADMVISPPWDPSARYARREEYQIAIARLTAEGAIALLRPETGLSGAHVLILGYGRVGRLLAREMQKAGSLVTCAARDAAQRAWAQAEGCEALPLDALSAALGGFDVLVNTVPAPVLTEPLLSLVRRDAVLLELASAPGGIGAPVSTLAAVPAVISCEGTLPAGISSSTRSSAGFSRDAAAVSAARRAYPSYGERSKAGTFSCAVSSCASTRQPHSESGAVSVPTGCTVSKSSACACSYPGFFSIFLLPPANK